MDAMSQLQTPIKTIATDTWILATWEEFIQLSQESDDAHTKGYYFNGRMRFESMAALGNPHSRDHAIVISAIFLLAGLAKLDVDMHDNCTYRKTGSQEVQPDASFYIGENAEVVPWDATIIDLDRYPPPDLVIEVAYSSLADDKGEKRLLYEALGVREYWIIDVQQAQVLAFAIAHQGSTKITQSQVLPGLGMAVLEEALRKSRSMNHGKVSVWLLEQFGTLG
jgi:Uma2 family endonuclease